VERISVKNAAAEKGCTIQAIYKAIKFEKLDTEISKEFGFVLIKKNKRYENYIPMESQKRNVKTTKTTPINLTKKEE
jgi:hypothetical protein